jgi:carbamoyltransferase
MSGLMSKSTTEHEDFGILSLYGSHDSSATFVDVDGNLRVLEYERLANKRYAAFNKGAESFDVGTDDKTREDFISYIDGIIKSKPKLIVSNALCDQDHDLLKKYWPEAEIKPIEIHHFAHAASGYYQSPFEECLILSADGGGLDEGVSTTTKIYFANSHGIFPVQRIAVDFGAAYGKIGYPISEISKKGSNLAIAGKVMGICAYGNVIDEWIEPLESYYLRDNHELSTLSSRLGFDVHTHDVLSGQKGYDLAATSQYVFEKLMFNIVFDIYKQKQSNLVFTGGCGLNVLFNQKLRKYLEDRGFDLYVQPNPNDCGLSLGAYLLETKQKVDPVVYENFDILDRDSLDQYKEEYKFQPRTVEKIVELISQGKIGGIIQGKSEVGPRALGNRSIICDPSFKDMKDTLNAKVKFREWFRPFAPVCKYEDRDLYFEDAYESDYMSYAPVVREEYRESLISITHADNTSRLQTVKREQHELFYDILTEMKKVGKTPVILNTSFNIKGRPILTSYEDAFYVLKETELDFLITEEFIVEK